MIRALSDRVPKLWPPGPFALASAAARGVEAIVNGSRRALTCFVSLDAGPTRNAVAAMPTELGTGGVARILEPALSRLERTQMETAIERLSVRGS
jgi:malate/lactate dehydrogenase